MKSADTERHWVKYKWIRNRLKNLVASKRSQYVSNLTEELGKKPKKFGGLLSNKTKN